MRTILKTNTYSGIHSCQIFRYIYFLDIRFFDFLIKIYFIFICVQVFTNATIWSKTIRQQERNELILTCRKRSRTELGPDTLSWVWVWWWWLSLLWLWWWWWKWWFMMIMIMITIVMMIKIIMILMMIMMIRMRMMILMVVLTMIIMMIRMIMMMILTMLMMTILIILTSIRSSLDSRSNLLPWKVLLIIGYYCLLLVLLFIVLNK